MGTIEIDLLIALGGFALGFLTFFLGRKSGAHADGKQLGVILTELNHIKGGVSRIQGQIDSTSEKEDKRYAEIIQRLVSVESAAERANIRLDKMEVK
jgi:hypothetical protein